MTSADTPPAVRSPSRPVIRRLLTNSKREPAAPGFTAFSHHARNLTHIDGFDRAQYLPCLSRLSNCGGLQLVYPDDDVCARRWIGSQKQQRRITVNDNATRQYSVR